MTEQTDELKYAHAILTREAELIKLSTRHQSETKKVINLSPKEFRTPDSILSQQDFMRLKPVLATLQDILPVPIRGETLEDVANAFIEAYGNEVDFTELPAQHPSFTGFTRVYPFAYEKMGVIEISKGHLKDGNHRSIVLATLIKAGRIKYQPVKAQG